MICLNRTCNHTTQRSIWKSEVELVSSSAHWLRYQWRPKHVGSVVWRFGVHKHQGQVVGRSLEKQLVIYAVSLKHRPGIDPGKLKIPKQTIIMRSLYQCQRSSITHLLGMHDYVIQFCKGPCLSRQIFATTRQILTQFHNSIPMVFTKWLQQTDQRTSFRCRISQGIRAHHNNCPKSAKT